MPCEQYHQTSCFSRKQFISKPYLIRKTKLNIFNKFRFKERKVSLTTCPQALSGSYAFPSSSWPVNTHSSRYVFLNFLYMIIKCAYLNSNHDSPPRLPFFPKVHIISEILCHQRDYQRNFTLLASLLMKLHNKSWHQRH